MSRPALKVQYLHVERLCNAWEVVNVSSGDQRDHVTRSADTASVSDDHDVMFPIS
jgi:hypothetical protein